MRNYLKLSITFVVVLTSIALYSAISYSQNKSLLSLEIKKDNFANDTNYNDFIKDVTARVKKDYVEEKTDKQLSEAAANGILSSLDPHSSYMNEEELKEMQVQTKGEFGGLGIEVTLEYSLVKVISAIEGTPADKVGLKSGDYISKIDGEQVSGLSINDVVKKLRGKPGTKVNVTVLRKDEKTPIEFVIQRQIIKIQAVRSNQIKDVAYIKINSFSEQAITGTSAELKKLVSQIGKNNIKGLVIDLRNNPGGLLDAAVEISDLFLDKGQTIVSISGRNKANPKYYKDESNQTLVPNIPIAVLINEGSASASEIVAGALQDNKRGIVMGTKSFGKGSVQSVIPLGERKGALRMTTALYYTPSGKSIQAHGIEPDIILTDAKLEKTKDNKIDPRSEASLNNHLQSQIDKAVAEAQKSQLGDDNLDLYNTDYQLARSVDLLRGISVYKTISQ